MISHEISLILPLNSGRGNDVFSMFIGILEKSMISPEGQRSARLNALVSRPFCGNVKKS